MRDRPKHPGRGQMHRTSAKIPQRSKTVAGLLQASSNRETNAVKRPRPSGCRCRRVASGPHQRARSAERKSTHAPHKPAREACLLPTPVHLDRKTRLAATITKCKNVANFKSPAMNPSVRAADFYQYSASQAVQAASRGTHSDGQRSAALDNQRYCWLLLLSSAQLARHHAARQDTAPPGLNRLRSLPLLYCLSALVLRFAARTRRLG